MQLANSTNPRDMVDMMLSWENGDLSDAKTITLFQALVDTGQVSYGLWPKKEEN